MLEGVSYMTEYIFETSLLVHAATLTYVLGFAFRNQIILRLLVLIGTIFLLVCLFRAMAGHFTAEQHFGFEAAAWYWHFVDVVWIFLFFCIYIGSGYTGPLS